MVHIRQYNRKWGYKVFDKDGKMVLHDEEKEPEQHQKNFIESVRSRKPPPTSESDIFRSIIAISQT